MILTFGNVYGMGTDYITFYEVKPWGKQHDVKIRRLVSQVLKKILSKGNMYSDSRLNGSVRKGDENARARHARSNIIWHQHLVQDARRRLYTRSQTNIQKTHRRVISRAFPPFPPPPCLCKRPSQSTALDSNLLCMSIGKTVGMAVGMSVNAIGITIQNLTDLFLGIPVKLLSTGLCLVLDFL